MTRSGGLARLVSGGVTRILAGSLLGQGVLLAVSPLLTRIYSPRDFAALTVFTGFATVIGALITLSWERAIVIPRSEAQAQGIVILGAATIVSLGVLTAIVFLLAGPSIDRLFGTHVFASVWWLLPATVVCMGFYSLVSSWLVRKKQYGKLAARNVMLGLSQAASSVLLGLGGLGAAGLLSGMGIGRAVALFGIAPRSDLWRRSTVTRRRLHTLIVRYRRFPLVATWSRAFNVLGLQLPPIIIVAVYGTLEAGLYALTLRVLAAPIGIVADAVSQYFEGVFSERVRGRSTRLQSLIVSISIRLAAVAVVPAILVTLFAPDLFAFIFGEQWRVAGDFARIVVWFYAVQLCVSPITRALLVLEKQFQQLVWDISRAILTVIAVLLPLLFGGSLVTALILLTCTQVALYVIVFVMCLRAAGTAERRESAV